MPPQKPQQIITIAQRILSDIRKRQLRPGDAYISTAEAAKDLKVSGSTVNRAFQLLAMRGIVERRQRRGTIILDPDGQGIGGLERVQILVREDHLQAEGQWMEGLLLGLQHSLPGVELSIRFRPVDDEQEFVQKLVGELLSEGQSTGVVLIRSGVVTQRLIQASGLPAVVNGTLHPSIQGLPSLDRDQHQIGRILIDDLVNRRSRKFLILMRERMVGGDHRMLDAALAALSDHGITQKDFVLRFLPADSAAIHAEVETQLRKLGRHVGCLCRSERLADGVLKVVEQVGLAGAHIPKVAMADVASSSEPQPFSSITPELSAEQWGRRVGELLLASIKGELGRAEEEVIPVTIVPAAKGSVKDLVKD